MNEQLETIAKQKVADRLSSVQEYYFSQKLREIDSMNKAGKQVINLGIGSPDLPPHPDVIKVLAEESAKPDVHGYQNYKGAPALRQAISDWYQKWYGVTLNPNTEILPLIGSKEGIMHICMTYLNEGDKALVPNPGYPTYRSAVQLAGGECIEYELKEESNWIPDLEQIKQTIESSKSEAGAIKLLFVNYPHMPTGQLPTKQLFEDLVQLAKEQDILIVHDNPYSFILNDNPQSILSVEGAKEVALELNSLSKSHNMAGWRIGMLCGSEQHINEVLRFKSNMDSGMFLPLQLAAAKALTLGKDWHDQVNTIYKERREKVYELLDILNCSYAKDQAGMFVWASIPKAYANGYELSDEVLYGANVFITPGGIFGSAGNNYIRISLCSSVENLQKAINRLKEKEGEEAKEVQ
jgi:aspartate/methionine/tyrosine aminotransferase